MVRCPSLLQVKSTGFPHLGFTKPSVCSHEHIFHPKSSLVYHSPLKKLRYVPYQFDGMRTPQMALDKEQQRVRALEARALEAEGLLLQRDRARIRQAARARYGRVFPRGVVTAIFQAAAWSKCLIGWAQWIYIVYLAPCCRPPFLAHYRQVSTPTPHPRPLLFLPLAFDGTFRARFLQLEIDLARRNDNAASKHARVTMEETASAKIQWIAKGFLQRCRFKASCALPRCRGYLACSLFIDRVVCYFVALPFRCPASRHIRKFRENSLSEIRSEILKHSFPPIFSRTHTNLRCAQNHRLIQAELLSIRALQRSMRRTLEAGRRNEHRVRRSLAALLLQRVWRGRWVTHPLFA